MFKLYILTVVYKNECRTVNCHPHSTAYTQGAFCETGLNQTKVAPFHIVNFWNLFAQKIVRQAISAFSKIKETLVNSRSIRSY